MFRNQEAFEYLEKLSDVHESGRSVYWDREYKHISAKATGMISGDPSGLGGMYTNTKGLVGLLRRLECWFFRWPFLCMGRNYKFFDECRRLGFLVAKRRQWQFTNDMLRQVLSLSLIREHVPFDNEDHVSVVIGDGWGIMTSLLLLAFPKRKVVLVNLNKILLIDLISIRNTIPNVQIAVATNKEDINVAYEDPNINLIAVQADNAAIVTETPVDLAINILSMMEMTPQVIAEYFRILRSNKGESTFFYCSNKICKPLYDGTNVRFHEYPWRENDEIIIDEICKWSQLLYKKIPPRWYHRPYGDKTIWQRIACLEKEPQ